VPADPLGAVARHEPDDERAGDRDEDGQSAQQVIGRRGRRRREAGMATTESTIRVWARSVASATAARPRADRTSSTRRRSAREGRRMTRPRSTSRATTVDTEL
jgi:hypothetical protein